uniref:Uncharacterized protein n=1 Tax=Romanomermis culicivorax TaxID=13658 RepID=A0A915HTD1_ROMCU
MLRVRLFWKNDLSDRKQKIKQKENKSSETRETSILLRTGSFAEINTLKATKGDPLTVHECKKDFYMSLIENILTPHREQIKKPILINDEITIDEPGHKDVPCPLPQNLVLYYENFESELEFR